MSENFISALSETAQKHEPNVSVTENGALGYRTTHNRLVDLNFQLSSMRNWDEDRIWKAFLLAYNENPLYSMLWLFFARDIRGGAGERRVFRTVFPRLAAENPSMAAVLLKHVPEYGRWDDLIDIYVSSVPEKVRREAFRIIADQLAHDIAAEKAGKPVSLLGKWLPSPATSSSGTRLRSEQLRSDLGWTPRQYRKTLVSLRKAAGVVEQKMSAREWNGIDYEKVPSRAAMLYRDAFSRHDPDGYRDYIDGVENGEKTIHAAALFPHDIVHAYMDGPWDEVKPVDRTLEQQWNALPDYSLNPSTLVVVDGSGSMSTRVGSTTISCHDVARALAIYFSERLPGPFRNTFITFSHSPHLVRFFDDALSLHSRIEVLTMHDECWNTDIEKTFRLILDTAKDHHLKPEEMPANILILSDMEFDSAVEHSAGQTLFDGIAKQFADAGYQLPRLIFWNICSRSGTIPLTENDCGVALVSGFSPAIANMVLSGKLDPCECLKDALDADRYRPVREEVLSLG